MGVEQQHGTVGGLPEQDSSLRVTLVFRHKGSDWRLVHRHADALVQPIGMEQLALLARGPADPGQESAVGETLNVVQGLEPSNYIPIAW